MQRCPPFRSRRPRRSAFRAMCKPRWKPASASSCVWHLKQCGIHPPAHHKRERHQQATSTAYHYCSTNISTSHFVRYPSVEQDATFYTPSWHQRKILGQVPEDVSDLDTLVIAAQQPYCLCPLPSLPEHHHRRGWASPSVYKTAPVCNNIHLKTLSATERRHQQRAAKRWNAIWLLWYGGNLHQII